MLLASKTRLILNKIKFNFNIKIYTLQQRTRFFKLESQSICTEDISETAPLKVDNWTVLFENNRALISADVLLRRDLIDPIRVELRVERCELQRDNCVYFGGMSLKNLCDRLKVSPFVQEIRDAIEPRVAACPIVPGYYRLSNYSMDANLVQQLPLEGYRWLTSVTVFDQANSENRTQILCIQAHFRVMVTSKRRRPG